MLVLNKTYGKCGTRFLYLCKPDDNKLPHFLIPHFIHTTFDKLYKDLYITFEFKHWNDKFPIGTITQNIGAVDELYNFYEYTLYCKTLHVSIHAFTKDVLTETKNDERNERRPRQRRLDRRPQITPQSPVIPRNLIRLIAKRLHTDDPLQTLIHHHLRRRQIILRLPRQLPNPRPKHRNQNQHHRNRRHHEQRQFHRQKEHHHRPPH